MPNVLITLNHMAQSGGDFQNRYASAIPQVFPVPSPKEGKTKVSTKGRRIAVASHRPQSSRRARPMAVKRRKNAMVRATHFPSMQARQMNDPAVNRSTKNHRIISSIGFINFFANEVQKNSLVVRRAIDFMCSAGFWWGIFGALINLCFFIFMSPPVSRKNYRAKQPESSDPCCSFPGTIMGVPECVYGEKQGD